MLQWCHTALNTATEKHWALSPFPLLFSISIPPSSHSHPPSHPPLSPLWLTFISPHTSTPPPNPAPHPPLSLSAPAGEWADFTTHLSGGRQGVGLSPPLLFICPSSFSLPEQVNLSLLLQHPFSLSPFSDVAACLTFCLSLSLLSFSNLCCSCSLCSRYLYVYPSICLSVRIRIHQKVSHV